MFEATKPHDGQPQAVEPKPVPAPQPAPKQKKGSGKCPTCGRDTVNT